jgi:hypothetical protein
MTDTDRLVWLSSLRKGIAWHVVAGWRTRCGRHIGDLVDGKPLRGHLLTYTEALQRYEVIDCRRCSGIGTIVEPRGVPSRDRRG